MIEQGGRTVSIGRIFNRAFGVMRDNPEAVFGISLMLSGIPAGLSGAFVRYGLGQTVDPDAFPRLSIGIMLLGLLGMVAAFVLQTIVSGCITRATIAYSQGKRASIGDCLRTALPRLWPMIAVTILSSIGIGFGMLLLIVPGIILACMWAVIIPVTVAEGTSITASFSRASALSRGARWQIFGLFLIIGVMMALINAVIGIPSVLILGESSQNPINALNPFAVVLGVIGTTLNTSVMSSMMNALFVDLLEWKDGPMDEKLSEIFA